MLKHHREILDTILSVIEADYANDVGIMLIYGSCVNGTYNEKSDLDMIYVPRTDRGWALAQTFMIDGVGYDLWCAPWERLEAFARFDDMKVSVLLDSELVYCAGEAERARFDDLKQSARDIAEGPLTPELVGKARRHLETATGYYGALCLNGDLTAAGGILGEIADVMCLLNHTYLRYGTKRIVDELSALSRRPDGFIDAYCAVLSEEPRAACRRLIAMTGRFLEEIAVEVSPKPDVSAVSGLYEEISSHFHKIRRACARGDAMYAFLSAASLQYELDRAARQLDGKAASLRFIDAFDAGALESLSALADEAERAFVKLLVRHGVPVNRYKSTEEWVGSLYEGEGSSN